MKSQTSATTTSLSSSYDATGSEDLLVNRHPNWEHLLDSTEKKDKTEIKTPNGFSNDMDIDDERITRVIKTQSAMYMQQWKSYLRTYTSGGFYARVTQTKSDGILELSRYGLSMPTL